MSWLIWRQHRLAVLASLLLLVAVAVPLVISGLAMRSGYDQLGLAACAGHSDPRCLDLLGQFSDQYRGWGQQLLPWLNFVPVLFGALVGAPLVAREIEQRTYLLAWTQGVTRRRWLAAKVTALALVVVLLGAGFTALITWWRWPLDQLEGHFAPTVYDFEGLMPTAYTLFAFVLGTFVGVVLRRTVPAMGTLLAAFFVIRYLLVEVLLRPRFEAPLSTTLRASAARPTILAGAGNWETDGGFQDAVGRRLTADEVNRLARQAIDAGLSPNAWFQQHGYLRWLTYQPADRFWTFQVVEAAIFLGLSALLVAVTFRLIRRAA